MSKRWSDSVAGLSDFAHAPLAPPDRKVGRLVFLRLDILVFDGGETSRTLARSSSRDLRR
jgi:hypothetical protein